MAFLGLDVSKEKIDCCLLLPSLSKKPKRTVIKQSSQGYEQLHSWLTDNSVSLEGLTTVLEPTGVYSHQIVRWLYNQKASVCVVQPTQARNFARYHKMNSKNDAIDSQMLAQMGMEQGLHLKPWTPIEPLYEKLNFLLKRLNQTVQMRRREMNRLDGHDGIDAFIEADAYTKATIEFFDSQEKQIFAQVQELIASDVTLSKDFKLLKTIPGIGLKTASFLAVLFNTRTFTKAEQVAKFVGVIPREYKSGSSINAPARMSKSGSSFVRCKLYMCALSVIRGNSRIRKFYDRLIVAGKSKSCALGAVMHKLIVIAFGVWKNKLKYDEQFETNRQKCTEQIDDSADSPCLECKRALRPSRTYHEEHMQNDAVKAERSEPRSGCLDSELHVLRISTQGRDAETRNPDGT